MSDYTDAVERGLDGLQAVSTGSCPGCAECMEVDDYDDPEKHRIAWQSTDLASAESHFSWSPCGICGSKLGGDRYAWHWLDVKPSGNPNVPLREIMHQDDACVDCVRYLANGAEPE